MEKINIIIIRTLGNREKNIYLFQGKRWNVYPSSFHNDNPMYLPGGYSIFSAYVGSDPASTVHPKKYQEFQAPQKNILKF